MRKLIIISLCIFTSCSSDEKKNKEALEYCADVTFYHYMFHKNPMGDQPPFYTEKVLSRTKKFFKKHKLNEKFTNKDYFQSYAECEDFLQNKPKTFIELYAGKKFKNYDGAIFAE